MTIEELRDRFVTAKIKLGVAKQGSQPSNRVFVCGEAVKVSLLKQAKEQKRLERAIRAGEENMQKFGGEMMNPRLWPTLGIDEIGLMPDEPGLYCIFSSSTAQYIGMSKKSLLRRLKKHNVLGTLVKIFGRSIKVSFLSVEASEVRELESVLIQRLQPRLNIQNRFSHN